MVSGQWLLVSGQWSVVINNEQRTTNNGQRTTDNEQRTTDNEQRTTNNGQRTTNNEQRTTDNEQRTTDNGQRTTNNEQRTTKLMLNKIKRPPGNYTKKLITSLAFIICVWGQSLQPASAEGSRDLVENFGYRPYTEWLPSSSLAGIPRATLLKVYV